MSKIDYQHMMTVFYKGDWSSDGETREGISVSVGSVPSEEQFKGWWDVYIHHYKPLLEKKELYSKIKNTHAKRYLHTQVLGRNMQDLHHHTRCYQKAHDALGNINEAIKDMHEVLDYRPGDRAR